MQNIVAVEDTEFHTNSRVQAEDWHGVAMDDKPQFDFHKRPMTGEEYNKLPGVKVPHQLPPRGDYTIYSLVLPDGQE